MNSVPLYYCCKLQERGLKQLISNNQNRRHHLSRMSVSQIVSKVLPDISSLQIRKVTRAIMYVVGQNEIQVKMVLM